MPNHVTNILTIHGPEEQVRAVRERLSSGGILVDFNKVIPMPPELQVTSDGLVMLLENPFCARDPISNLVEGVRKARAEVVDNFCQALKNLNKYGLPSWYAWAPKHWGTKWNAYDAKESAPNEVVFDTAWAHPAPVFEALSKAFPGVELEVRYADEDIGQNYGHFSLLNGIKTAKETPAPGSREARLFAYVVKGRDAEAEERELGEDEL